MYSGDQNWEGSRVTSCVSVPCTPSVFPPRPRERQQMRKVDGVVAFYFTATFVSFRRQVGRKQDLGAVLWRVRSSGVRTKAVTLAKCF